MHERHDLRLERDELMPIIALLLADQRGTVLVRYSSIALLVAIAAIAVLSRADGHFLN